MAKKPIRSLNTALRETVFDKGREKPSYSVTLMCGNENHTGNYIALDRRLYYSPEYMALAQGV